jgi:hypothetical protein
MRCLLLAALAAAQLIVALAQVPGSIAFHTVAGQALLASHTTLNTTAFYFLAEAYATQVTQSFCSLATSVIILVRVFLRFCTLFVCSP